MPAIALGFIDWNTGSFQSFIDVVPKRTFKRASFVGGVMRHKDIWVIRNGPPVFQVINDRPPRIIRKRKR